MWSANRCECLTFLPVALNPRKSLNIRSYSQGEEWGFLGQHEAGDTPHGRASQAMQTRGGLEPQPIHAPGREERLRVLSVRDTIESWRLKLLGVSREALNRHPSLAQLGTGGRVRKTVSRLASFGLQRQSVRRSSLLGIP